MDERTRYREQTKRMLEQLERAPRLRKTGELIDSGFHLKGKEEADILLRILWNERKVVRGEKCACGNDHYARGVCKGCYGKMKYKERKSNVPKMQLQSQNRLEGNY